MNTDRWGSLVSAIGGVKLRTLMVSLAIIALVLALIVLSNRAAEQEKRLRTRVSQAISKSWADEKMRFFLGDLGIVILKDVTQVELLQVGSPKASQRYSRTPTGKVFDKKFANRITRILLDKKNYSYMDAGDMPDPEIGLRLWRGKDSIDLLFSLESSGSGSSHQDGWAFVIPEHGDLLKVNGPQACFNDPELGKLINELKAIDVTVPERESTND